MTASRVLFAVFILLGTQEAFSKKLPNTCGNLKPNTSAPNVANMQTKWITQKLDNFDKNNSETWQMRYMVDESYYKPGGPFIVNVGGQWPISPEQPYGTPLPEIVQQYNGLLIYTEHRFYGESRPKPQLKVEYLEKYLSVEQGLADLAHLIRTLKQTYNGAQKSKVILAGGSYSGLIVTWFAELYPELSDGVWASSATVLSKPDYFEFKVIMGEAILEKSGPNCYNRVKNGIQHAQDLFNQGKGAEVKSALNLCSNFNENSSLDRSNLFKSYADIFEGIFIFATANTVQEVCGNFTNINDDYVNFVNYFALNYGNANNDCIDMSYNASLPSSIEYDLNPSGLRQAYFQACNEFGQFETSNSTAQPFGSEYPLQYFIQRCTDLFGKKYTVKYNAKRAESYNKKYGALNPKVKNVFFTQGSLDPWKDLGIQTYVIEGASHSEDLLSKPSSSDSPQMAAARIKIAENIQNWVCGK